jgi:hypothetical protein
MKNIPETFYAKLKEANSAKSKAKKIEVLHKYSDANLKTILGYTFDPGVKWLLPEGNPPYKPLEAHSDQESKLAYEVKKLYLFVAGVTDAQKNLKQSRREQLFIQLLESVDPDDALLLLSMKDKTLPFKTITKTLVAEAFPNLAKKW